VRQAPIKGFPYHVIDLETAETIHLLAFAHDKRRPAYWLLRSVGFLIMSAHFLRIQTPHVTGPASLSLIGRPVNLRASFI
jgi:hypothetical protein